MAAAAAASGAAAAEALVQAPCSVWRREYLLRICRSRSDPAGRVGRGRRPRIACPVEVLPPRCVSVPDAARTPGPRSRAPPPWRGSRPQVTPFRADGTIIHLLEGKSRSTIQVLQLRNGDAGQPQPSPILPIPHSLSPLSLSPLVGLDPVAYVQDNFISN